MKLLVTKGAQKGAVIPLANAVISIGRELDNDFVINEAGVSRHHCKLSPIGQEWFVEDCKSVNGVLLNGTKITQGTPLKTGDAFTVFSHEFQFLPDADGVGPVRDDAESLPFKGSDNQPVAQMIKLQREKRGILWGKIILLLVILGLVVYLAMQVFSSSDDSSKSPVSVETVAGVKTESEATTGVVETAENEISPAADSVEASLVTEQQDVQDNAETTAKTTEVQEVAPVQQQPVERAGVAAVSDVVLALSDPPGAEVYLDGELQDGLTPTVLRNIRPGRHSLEMQLDGYEVSRRTIHVPDIQATRPVVLRPKAGTLLLISTPAGAHVWLERQLLGVTPVLLEDLPPGKYELTLRGPGCESKKVPAEIKAASGEALEVTLQVNLGNLELRTQPPNCGIFLQGCLLGVTSAEDDLAESKPLLLKNIMAGDQRFKIEHQSGVSVSGRISILRNETVTKVIRMHLPTHRLVTVDGLVVDGVLLETNHQGDVVLEDLYKKSERYLKPKIKELRTLTDEEILAAVEAAKNPGKRGDDLLGMKDDVLTIADLERALNIPTEDFNKANAGKVFKISGKSTMLLPGQKGITTVVFAPKIRCQFADLSKEEMEFLTASDQQSVTFQGTCFGVGKDAILLFKNCKFLSEF